MEVEGPPPLLPKTGIPDLVLLQCATPRGFPGGSVNIGGAGSMAGSRRSPGEGNGNPLQYSCLGNPMDKGPCCCCCCCQVASIVSDSVRPHRWQPTRLPRHWDSPGKNTGVGCHFLLQCMKVKSESEVAQSCPTLCYPIDGSPPGSAIPGILQERTLEWVAISFSNA